MSQRGCAVLRSAVATKILWSAMASEAMVASGVTRVVLTTVNAVPGKTLSQKAVPMIWIVATTASNVAKLAWFRTPIGANKKKAIRMLG